MREVTRNGDFLIIRFDYDPALVERVKGLPGRRWDPENRQWIVPAVFAPAVVHLLGPEGFLFGEGIQQLANAQGEEARDHLKVSELNQRVQAALKREFPEPVWVVGEILGYGKSLGKNKSYVDFQLVERLEGRIVAAAEAVLFREERGKIEEKLHEAGDPYALQDELMVRVLAQVDLQTQWGRYRLVIRDLDVHYTLGEAARRKEEILRKLAKEGLLELNKALPFPLVPLRVGVITSLGSDAERDVLRTLAESGFAFQVVVHGARVQGHYTEPSILNALDWFRQRIADFDVLVICRGGGSRADLAWFDSEVLGRAVATFPLPVVVGIGHEEDRSVLDEVGWRQKTPTAAAQFLVAQVQETLDRLEKNLVQVVQEAQAAVDRAGQGHRERVGRFLRAAQNAVKREESELRGRLKRLQAHVQGQLRAAREKNRDIVWVLPTRVASFLGRKGEQLEQAEVRLLRSSRRELRDARVEVEQLQAEVGARGLGLLQRQLQKIEAQHQRLQALDPRRVVERGFAILRRVDGSVVTSPHQAPPGTNLRAQLRGGRLRLLSEGEERGE